MSGQVARATPDRRLRRTVIFTFAAKFLEESGLEWLRGVKAVVMDRNASCNKLVKRHMPRADIVYDRCHMQAQYGKDVLGVVRLQEASRGSILRFRPRPRPVPIRTGGLC